QLGVVGAPESRVELGEACGETAENGAGRVAPADRFVEQLATGSVTADVLRHPRGDFDMRSARLRLRLHGLFLAVEVLGEPVEVERAQELPLGLASLAVVVDRLVPDVEH